MRLQRRHSDTSLTKKGLMKWQSNKYCTYEEPEEEQDLNIPEKNSLYNFWLMYIDKHTVYIYRPPVTRAPDFKEKVPVRFFFTFS